MSLIHYNTVQIDAVATQIQQASAQTEQNHQRSLQIVNASADNFGGRGSEAFQSVIAQVNHVYRGQQETIQRAGAALSTANGQMTQGDSQSAAQYI